MCFCAIYVGQKLTLNITHLILDYCFRSIVHDTVSELLSMWLLFYTKWKKIQHYHAWPSAKTSYILWDYDDVHFELDQHAKLNFYSASLTETSLWVDIIMISSQPIFAYSLMLHAGRRSCKYQLISLWFHGRVYMLISNNLLFLLHVPMSMVQW